MSIQLEVKCTFCEKVSRYSLKQMDYMNQENIIKKIFSTKEVVICKNCRKFCSSLKREMNSRECISVYEEINQEIKKTLRKYYLDNEKDFKANIL